MPVIKCPDGKLRDYADYEDNVKPMWKERMREEMIRCPNCGNKTNIKKIYKGDEDVYMYYCDECGWSRFIDNEI